MELDQITDQGMEEHVFKKRESLARTPPEGLKNADKKKKMVVESPEEKVSEEIDAKQKAKRKKQESESLIELETVTGEMKTLIKRVANTTKLLKTLAQTNVNTKVEIKKAIGDASRQVETLTRKTQQWGGLLQRELATREEETPNPVINRRVASTPTEEVESIKTVA